MYAYLVYYILGFVMIPGIMLGIYAQIKVKSTFDEYSKTPTNKGRTAKEVARSMLNGGGCYETEIKEIRGNLTDNFNPKTNPVNLSEKVYNNCSLSALGVMAHEVGHAIQHHQKSFMFRLRQFISPVVGFVSKAFFPLVLLGSIFNIMFLLPTIGYYIVFGSVIFYGASLIFELITLPLEYDASKKAMKMLSETETLNSTELSKTKEVLSAAAQTYVASLASTLLYFIRFFSLLMMFHRDD